MNKTLPSKFAQFRRREESASETVKSESMINVLGNNNVDTSHVLN